MSRFFYVSVVRDTRRKAFLAGPYATHAESLAVVETVRSKAIALDSWMHFDAFGTASADSEMKTYFGAITP